MLARRTQMRARGCCDCAASLDGPVGVASVRHTRRQGREMVPCRGKTNSRQRLRHPSTRALLPNRAGRRPAESDRSPQKYADARRDLPGRADASCKAVPIRDHYASRSLQSVAASQHWGHLAWTTWRARRAATGSQPPGSRLPQMPSERSARGWPTCCCATTARLWATGCRDCRHSRPTSGPPPR